MNKQIINLILIVGSVAILAAIVISFGSQSNNGVLTAEATAYDFGTISMANGNVSHGFRLKNESLETVKIENIYTSCMCTIAKVVDGSGKNYGPFGMPGHGDSAKANIEIGPAEAIVVEAEFDPAAHGPEGVGKIKRLIYIETNSKIKPQLQLAIEAEVIN